MQLLTGSVALPVHNAHSWARNRYFVTVTRFSSPILVTVTLVLESTNNDVTDNLVKYIYYQSNLVLLVTVSNGSE